MDAKIVYTEFGKAAVDKFLEEQKELLEKNIYKKKYVLGDEEIEISASDINNYKKKMNSKKRLSFFLEIFTLIGIIILGIGMLYPFLLNMMENSSLQFIFIALGCILVIVGGFSLLYLSQKRLVKEEEIEDLR